MCLSFSQLKKIEFQCENYRLLAQSACGNPFLVSELKKQHEEKTIALRKAIVEKSEQNFDQWKVERDQKRAEKQEQREKNRLILLQQIEETKEQKVQKRREELEIEKEYLKQCEIAELELVERENEHRRKNIEYYTELANIVDAQHKRTENEIETLKVKLAEKKDIDEKSIASDRSSDNESEYFDAEKSYSSTSSKAFYSPEEKVTTIPRSISDILNSNAAADDLSVDRARNRANILSSNINLATFDNAETQKVAIPSNELTEAQKNKIKMFQQEYGFVDPNANVNEITIQVEPIELTDLQRNRQKVLSSEFGITDVVVKLSANERTQKMTDFERNKQLAKSHVHTFNQSKDFNANNPINGLQRNREKVLSQEYGLITPRTNESLAVRNKLRASLSLELDNAKPNELCVKQCQSDFALSPMSTTSDTIVASESAANYSSDNKEKDESPRNQLKLDCSKVFGRDFDQFTGESELQPTPLSALNTAGLERKYNGLALTPSPKFLQMIRPSFTSTNIFDISSQLSSSNKKELSPNQASKMLSANEIQDLNSANLTYFLQQSFVIPFQVHFAILNNEILKIFFDDLDVLSHFNSLRNYFFMMDGEFACNISDGLLTKLHSTRKPKELLNSHTLHSILENALQSSLMGKNKNAENLSFCIPNIPESFEMASPNVLNDLHLSYKVEWPLNLLISDEAIEQYDRVFLHLLKLRRITWLLEQCFYVCSI